MASKPTLSFSSKNRFGIALQVLLTIVAVIASLAMINYLSSRYYHRAQLAAAGRVELSDLTKNLLRGLNTNVNVHFFFDSSHELYSHVDGLLKEYARQSRFINLRRVDNLLNPSSSAELKARFKLEEKNVVIFECEGRTRKIVSSEMSDYAYAEGETSGEVYKKIVGFKGEPLFSGAILSVLEKEPLKVYYVEGHGEPSINNTNATGYHRFAEIVRENNAEIIVMSLEETNAIPSDCKLLVLAGTSQTLPQVELDKINAYLEQGGRALILFDMRRFHTPNGLEQVLARWNINVGLNVITDSENLDPVESFPFPNHPISSPLLDYTVVLVPPRSVVPVSSGSAADSPKAARLLITSPQSRWLSANEKGQPQATSKDPIGVGTVAAAVERGNIRGVSANKSATRIVVVGDSFFLNNQIIDQGANADFARLTLSWLMDRSEMLKGVGPRPKPVMAALS